MRSLPLLLLLFPLLELWLLIKLGAWLGALPTVALVVLSSALGVAILRRVGWRTLASAQLSLRRQVSPVPVLIDGFALALAGVLLLIPGLLSDLAALLLLIAPLRRRLLRDRYAAAAAGPRGSAQAGRFTSEDAREPAVIDGEYRREP